MTNLSTIALMPIDVYECFDGNTVDLYICHDDEGVYVDLNRYFDSPHSYTTATYIDNAIHTITNIDKIRCISDDKWFYNIWNCDDNLYHAEENTVYLAKHKSDV